LILIIGWYSVVFYSCGKTLSYMQQAAMKPFNDYSSYIRTTFGERVQKISIETGYSCPNRDGEKGKGGCTYCNLDSIRAAYLKNTHTITDQILQGTEFFKKRNKTGKFLAYFQTYSNTYSDIATLKKDYEEALGFPGVVGIVIGTRPDCISDELVQYLQELAKKHYVSIELGIESTDEESLVRINRCHTFQDTVDAVNLLSNRGIKIGGHLILGLPWESENVMLSHARKLSSLPLDFLKLHHLQVLKYTQLAREHQKSPFTFLAPESYMDLIISFLEISRPDIVFQRFLAEAPTRLLIAPQWGGVKNYQFTQLLVQRMAGLGTYQGKRFENQG
jgi:uncharacterized protein